jgi:hypothetical protein
LGYSELIQRLFEKMAFFLLDPLVERWNAKIKAKEHS